MIKGIKAFNYMQIDMHIYIYIRKCEFTSTYGQKKCQHIDIPYDLKNTYTIIKNTEL